MLEEALGNYGAEFSDLNVKMELDSTEAVKSAVSENLGISLVPKSTLIKIHENIKNIPMATIMFPFNFNIIYHREKGLTSLTLELIECLKERLSHQFGDLTFNSCL